MQTSNPAFQGDIFSDWAAADRRSTTMTVQGTAFKTLILLAILAATAVWSWTGAARGEMNMPLLIGSAILGSVVAFVTIFWRNVAPWTAPVYAGLEGIFLGAFSYWIDLRYGRGLAFQAVTLTMTTLLCMLMLYATRAIRVTDKLRMGIIGATGALALFYMGAILLSFFGLGGGLAFIFSAGPIGIGFSLFVVGLAAFNLLLDFDYIERSAQVGAPKAMEWYGAFGLLVTLIWLYLEILRLLRKFQSRN